MSNRVIKTVNIKHKVNISFKKKKGTESKD